MNKTCKVYKQNSSIFLDSHLYIKSILYLRLQSVTAKISVSDKHSCIKNINYNSLRRNADNIYFSQCQRYTLYNAIFYYISV